MRAQVVTWSKQSPEATYWRNLVCKNVLLMGGGINKDKKLMQCKLNKLGFDRIKL